MVFARALTISEGIVFKGIGAASEAFHSIYEEAKRMGVDDRLSIKHAAEKAFGTGVLNILNEVELNGFKIQNVDDAFSKIIGEGIKNGMFEVVEQALGTFGNRSPQEESDESAESRRNGFLGGTLQGTVEEVLKKMRR